MRENRQDKNIHNILYLNSTSMMSGAEFSLLSLMDKTDRERFDPILLLPEDGSFFKQANKAGIEAIALSSLIRFGEPYRFYKLPKVVNALYKMIHIIKQKRISLIHSNSPRVAYVGGMAAKLSSIPSIIHVRDIHLSPFSQPLKARLLGSLSDRIIAVSSAVKDSIVSVTPSLESKINVVYNGMDIEGLDKRSIHDVRHELGITKNTPIIGSVGLIHPVKGLDILIQSAAIIKSRIPSIKVLIIGGTLLENERNYKYELECLVRDLKLEDNVIFTGFREDVFDLIGAMDVLVHPAVYPEPFPRSLLEGSALKKPIVGTRVGGVPEILVHNESGLLVEPGDHASMARAILSLLENKEKAENFALEARQRVEKFFSLKRHVGNIENMYLKLLGRSS